MSSNLPECEWILFIRILCNCPIFFLISHIRSLGIVCQSWSWAPHCLLCQEHWVSLNENFSFKVSTFLSIKLLAKVVVSKLFFKEITLWNILFPPTLFYAFTSVIHLYTELYQNKYFYQIKTTYCLKYLEIVLVQTIDFIFFID